MSDMPHAPKPSPARTHGDADSDTGVTIPAEAEDIVAEEQRDTERLDEEALQRPDPAADDLPDRAFDRIAPGV